MVEKLVDTQTIQSKWRAVLQQSLSKVRIEGRIDLPAAAQTCQAFLVVIPVHQGHTDNQLLPTFQCLFLNRVQLSSSTGTSTTCSPVSW